MAAVLTAATAVPVAAAPGAPAAALTPAAPTASAAAASLEGRAVLAPNVSGYTCFRIPALATAENGTLLLFAEARKPTCGDTGTHDVVLIRSVDSGKNWEKTPEVIHQGAGSTAHNPVPVVDRESGRITLLTTRAYRTVWAQHSDDNGESWSAPREITSSVKLPNWQGYATGPSHGIQLTRGAHAGRLVVGTNYTTVDGVKGGALIYSDDGGLTWQLGAHDESADPDLRVQELSVFERPDGSLFAFARNENGTSPSTVAAAVSTDAGQSFSVPFHAGAAETGWASPTVQASTLELRATDRGDRYNRVLVASPTTEEVRPDGNPRKNLTIRSTFKGGNEWVDPRGGTVIYSGYAAYTDMTLVNANTVGLAYERATNWSHGYLWFTTFTEADLGLPDGNTSGLPTTPDSSPNKLDAYLRGGVSATTGRFGRAIALDGTDDRVQLPFAEKLAVSSNDFTWTGWFNYGASTSTQALVWAYNQGDVYSQLWLRAEPANGRLRALAQSGETAAVVSTTKAYNDRKWHHVALRRAGGTLSIHVDGVRAGSVDVSAVGSVSPKRPFQIHLGQRLDGEQRLRGALDEVRLYGRALTDAEIGQVYSANAALPDGLLIRLPMDTTTG
ncbi:exo-alpha-sialidase [Goodfellowiella coeruleoviolacea]|uniref:exo-alpha-sialidase n=1 Tax=Goodfellowiella coeruleoviolacea TaxID=334858 RepID=UPI0020A3A83F|nr:sialidase family protein [Goodfellowiella coeruleoviolacea]